MVKRLGPLISVAALSAAFFGCALNPVTGQRELMFVSEGQEVEMGRDLYPNAIWGAEGGGGEYRDERLRTYLRDIVLRIHAVSHRPNLPVEFTVQNSSAPNAWAIPGHVVMTRGLLAGLDNEAEFAFVMGHEMGHVAARHSARQMTSSMLLQLGLAGVGMGLGGSGSADLAVGLGSVGGGLVLLKYSRGHELEADRLGVLYMSRLGYEPRNALSAHRNLEKISQQYLDSLGKAPHERSFFEDLLSTHPRTSVRIEEIEQIIRTTPPAAVAGDGAFGARFKEMTAGLGRVNAVYREYYDKAAAAFQKNNLAEAEGLVAKAISLDKSQPPFHTLRGFVLLKKKDYAEADRSFDAALDLDRSYAPAHRGLGASRYYRSDYQEGIEHLKRALSLFPQDGAAHYFLGMSYFRTRAYRGAVQYLKPFADGQPKHPEVHGVLGISYEQLNDIHSAYNEYVLQLKVAPDNEMGRHAAARAPALRALIEAQKRRQSVQ